MPGSRRRRAGAGAHGWLASEWHAATPIAIVFVAYLTGFEPGVANVALLLGMLTLAFVVGVQACDDVRDWRSA